MKYMLILILLATGCPSKTDEPVPDESVPAPDVSQAAADAGPVNVADVAKAADATAIVDTARAD